MEPPPASDVALADGGRSQLREAACARLPLASSLAVMARWRLRQVFALALGLLVALGMSLSTVQASDMAVEKAMASDTGASGMAGTGHGGCGGCDDGGSAKDMSCAPACMAPVSAATLPQGWSVTVRQTSDPSTRPYLHRLGRAPAPDPTPPRPGDLG